MLMRLRRRLMLLRLMNLRLRLALQLGLRWWLRRYLTGWRRHWGMMNIAVRRWRVGRMACGWAI